MNRNSSPRLSDRVDRLQELNAYWKGQLRDLEPLDLPSDHSRPVTPSCRGERVCFQIDAQLLEPFEELCRGEEATLQTGLLALVAVLLHRYSGQDDVAIGVPILGCNHPELETSIGLFINTLPIRTRFQARLSFRQLLTLVRDTLIGGYDHQKLPFEQMVEVLNDEPGAGWNALVQVMLQLKELPESPLLGLEDLETELHEGRTTISQFDLEFLLRRHPRGGLNAEIIYATDLFDVDRIKRLSSHLVTLLGSALEDPDAAVDALNLLPETERKMIESWQQARI